MLISNEALALQPPQRAVLELQRACGGCCRCNETAISLKAGCQLFLRYTTRTSALDAEDFEAAKRRIIDVRHSCKRAASQCT